MCLYWKVVGLVCLYTYWKGWMPGESVFEGLLACCVCIRKFGGLVCLFIGQVGGLVCLYI